MKNKQNDFEYETDINSINILKTNTIKQYVYSVLVFNVNRYNLQGFSS